MADENKVYYPETIEPQPLPVSGEVTLNGGGSVKDTEGSPTAIRDRLRTISRAAHQLLSNSLNTVSKKILATYTFGVMGAIQIGEYLSGVSGDVRITPDGITARNSAGETTFALDGATGGAIFKGTVQAADFVIADENGLVSLNNFVTNSVNNASARTVSNSAAYADIANTSITTVALARATKVLIMYTMNVVEFPINGTSAFAGKVTLNIDGTDQVSNSFELQLTSQSPYADTASWGGPLTAIGVVELAAGTHVLKLRGQTVNTNSQLNIESTSVIYSVLGT